MASGVTARPPSRGCNPSSTSARLALGESCRPAPASSRRSAFSRMTTRKPRRASASEAVNPPIPAPATKMVREAATGRSGDLVSHHAFRRPGFAGREVGGVAVQGRAIGADDLVVVAQIEENMGVIERRIGAHAHEFLRADLDDGDADIVVKMGNDMVGHSIHLGSNGGGRKSTRRRMVERSAPYWRVQLIPRAPAAHLLMQIRHTLVVPETPFFR